MPMEIHPLPGQPGLFRRGLEGRTRATWTSTSTRRRARQHRDPQPYDGLGSTRWTAISGGAMDHAPFGNRSRRGGLDGFGALLIPGVKEIPVSGTWDGQIFQEDIPSGKVAGILLKMVFTTPGPLVPQLALDQAFRAMLAKLGYDVGSSSISAQQIGYTWTVDASGGTTTWNWTVASGPREILGIWGFQQQAPTDADKAALPATAETYTVLARPKTGVVTKESLNALLGELRAASTQLKKSFPDAKAYPFLIITGVPPVPGMEPPKSSGGIGLVLGLIGVGWLSYLAMQGKQGMG